MSIDFSKTPDAFFFAPGIDPGFHLTDTPKWTWREMSKGNIVGYPMSAYEHLNEMIATLIRNHDRLR